jgi:hypothetical protein
MSAGSVPEFRRDLDRVLLKILGRSHRFKQALTLEALRRLVLRTPVDTGRARGSWQVTSGPRPRVPLSAWIPAGPPPSGRGATAVAELTPGEDAFICSNLVYMPELERGHSKQAPAGIVAVTVEELKLISDRLATQIADGKDQ